MYIAISKEQVVTAVSTHEVKINNHSTQEIVDKNAENLINKKIKTNKKEKKDLKVGMVFNYKDSCGIATYGKYLSDAIRPLVKDLFIFAEKIENIEKEDYVIPCWKRGQNLRECVKEIKSRDLDLVITQHEWGLWFNPQFLLEFIQSIDDVSHIITLHSVYENHLDKAIISSTFPNIVVHTEESKKVLNNLGIISPIFVIPHGCINFTNEERKELWNIFKKDMFLIQFGFSNTYKNVDSVIRAVNYLKTTDPKFKDIFFLYLCSCNTWSNSSHTEYYNSLLKLVTELNLQDNVVIIKKFHSEQIINNYLRTAKIAVFPYKAAENHDVYASSGAIKIAMANGIPCISSNVHLFDDIKHVVPQVKDYLELSKEIDHIFSNSNYRQELINKNLKYVEENSWFKCADKYLDLYYQI